ncbi:MAG: hypothetical protein ACJA1E_001532 [Paracoccaceae bacterium]|jgi:hypothetical protein
MWLCAASISRDKPLRYLIKRLHFLEYALLCCSFQYGECCLMIPQQGCGCERLMPRGIYKDFQRLAVLSRPQIAVHAVQHQLEKLLLFYFTA